MGSRIEAEAQISLGHVLGRRSAKRINLIFTPASGTKWRVTEDDLDLPGSEFISKIKKQNEEIKKQEEEALRMTWHMTLRNPVNGREVVGGVRLKPMADIETVDSAERYCIYMAEIDGPASQAQSAVEGCDAADGGGGFSYATPVAMSGVFGLFFPVSDEVGVVSAASASSAPVSMPEKPGMRHEFFPVCSTTIMPHFLLDVDFFGVLIWITDVVVS